jgi:hypothetical protein
LKEKDEVLRTYNGCKDVIISEPLIMLIV